MFNYWSRTGSIFDQAAPVERVVGNTEGVEQADERPVAVQLGGVTHNPFHAISDADAGMAAWAGGGQQAYLDRLRSAE